MPPVKVFGRRAPFPRAGAWTRLSDGRVGIIFDIKKINVEDPASTEDNPLPSLAVDEAEVHTVNTDRTTVESVKLPADQLAMATYSDIAPYLGSDHSVFEVASMGYELNSSQLSNLTALQRMRLGKSFNDADKANALVEESKEQALVLQRQAVSQHADAIALEEEIEKERLSFVKNIEQRRQAMHDKIVKELGL